MHFPNTLLNGMEWKERKIYIVKSFEINIYAFI